MIRFWVEDFGTEQFNGYNYIRVRFDRWLHINTIGKQVWEKIVRKHAYTSQRLEYTHCNTNSKVINRQPRKFIYPKDGGRVDVPKMYVFTQLLRKSFTGKPKVRLKPPNPQFVEDQNGPFLLQRRHGYKLLKIVHWDPLNTETARKITLGLVNFPTVTNLGGSKMVFIYSKDSVDKNCFKSFTGSTEHWNGENSNFKFG